ncbi:PRC-barrel domain-containing protein [Mucilaginibacter litoreus]|uniref:PRC-barrel domain-containing protein n=1 Tax=Mucilaginibacter litoreus TaxID=1048221 RepID=A0ABW3AWX9_9SPHI
MKHSLDNLIGFTIVGIDGEIGKVKEFYFDDKAWTIRYMIVETGNWLIGRKILLSPQAITASDWDRSTFSVDLTTEQIKNSPDIDTDKPVSLQNEMDLYGYYPWGSYYWGGSMGISGLAMSYPIGISQTTPVENDKNKNGASDEDHHLRSTDKVTGYSIQATDEEIGNVEDFILNDSTWKIDFMLVDTGNWFPGKKVLIAPGMIKDINWETSTVTVNASEKVIKDSPEYTPGEALNETYETTLESYYGRAISPDLK